MATRDTRLRTTWGNRFRFLVRFLGLTGLMAAAVGAVLGSTVFTDATRWSPEAARAVLEGHEGPFPQAALWTLAVGLGLAALALLVEIVGGLLLVAGRRTAAGTSATVATLAAAALLVFVNLYSFSHYRRFDLTRDRQFTLPAAVADELRKLRPDSPTTIVVFQQHKTFGTLSEKPDSYDYAAERKVVEKVKDLVDQFREFGPRFNVVVLDVEEEGYERRLADLTRDAPELRAAIEAAPENSIFFHAAGKVQRLGFNEFLQLDKTASKEAGGGRGNLVLLPQGVESFARRVLAVQERRPRVAVAVVHEWLGTDVTEGSEEYTQAGLKKALTDYGFEVADIILKKNWEVESKDLEPAAYTREESKLERLEAELAEAEEEAAAARAQAALFAEVLKRVEEVKGRPWADRSALYGKLVQGRVTEEVEPQLLASIARQADRARQLVEEAERDRRAADERLRTAYRDERAVQDRRLTDVKAKFTRLLADVDLLIVPRYTVVNPVLGLGVSPSIHTLSKEQAEVIKDFMKSGRPVMACLGPISGRAGGPQLSAVDDFERLLAERGVELGRETILFEGEARAFAARRAGSQLGGAGPADIPPLAIEDRADGPEVRPNPVGAAMKVTGRSVDQRLDLRLRAPRPVYLASGWREKVPFAAEFVLTGQDSWNEMRPFPQLRQLPDGSVAITNIPRYDPTPLDDPKKGTREEERRGPFPVGVAVESKIPAHWLNEEYARQQAVAGLLTPLDGVLAAGLTAAAQKLDRPTGRLIVFGSGSLFTGPQLKPAQEKLLLHSVNWLTNRPDRLPSVPQKPWSFPRVEMTDREAFLWRAGTAAGLPLLAVYLGLVAVMVRRMR